jgi:sulfur carrier protein
MDVLVNGKSRAVQDGAGLRMLLESLRLPSLESGIAVCLNGEVVRRQDWERTALRDRDEVEIVTAAQGG